MTLPVTMYRCEGIEACIGKTLASAFLEDQGMRIVLRFDDGTEWAADVEGDCCSESWIEHLEVPPDIAGAILTGVTESDKVKAPEDGAHGSQEELQVYGVAFATSKGEIILEFRNSSNGYYGGSLVEVAR